MAVDAVIVHSGAFSRYTLARVMETLPDEDLDE
jgi:hypothetical protein